jgi:hypothetical protein
VWPPPLLRDRSFALQIVLAVVLPVLFGVVCGWLLGASGLWFHIVVTAGGLGGVNAGFEHEGWRGGLLRGAVGGPLFAIALIATHEARGATAAARLPLALPLMMIFYASMSMPLGALGGWLRGRREQARRAPDLVASASS